MKKSEVKQGHLRMQCVNLSVDLAF